MVYTLLFDAAPPAGSSMFSALAARLAQGTILDTPTKELGSTMRDACLKLAGVFFLIQLALNVIKIQIGQSKDGFHFLWKYFALLITLGSYTTLMPLVDMMVDVPINAMRTVANTRTAKGMVQANLATYTNPAAAPPAPVDQETGLQKVEDLALNTFDAFHVARAIWSVNKYVGNGIVNTVTGQNDVLSPSKWGTDAVISIVNLAYGIVSLIVSLIQAYAISILYITGPIAITFSMLSGFEGGFAGWLKYYIVIKLWLVIVYVIQSLDATLALQNMGVNGVVSDEALAFQIGSLVMYMMVPKFADILISGSQGGAFFSAAVAGASMVAGKAMGAIKGSGKAAAGSVLDVAGTGKGNDAHTKVGKAIGHIASAFGGKKKD